MLVVLQQSAAVGVVEVQRFAAVRMVERFFGSPVPASVALTSGIHSLWQGGRCGCSGWYSCSG